MGEEEEREEDGEEKGDGERDGERRGKHRDKNIFELKYQLSEPYPHSSQCLKNIRMRNSLPFRYLWLCPNKAQTSSLQLHLCPLMRWLSLY